MMLTPMPPFATISPRVFAAAAAAFTTLPPACHADAAARFFDAFDAATLSPLFAADADSRVSPLYAHYRQETFASVIATPLLPASAYGLMPRPPPRRCHAALLRRSMIDDAFDVDADALISIGRSALRCQRRLFSVTSAAMPVDV